MKSYPFKQPEINEIQNKRLKKLIRHAYKIPFYKDRFQKAGLTPDSINNINDLKKLPVLSKTDYRNWIINEYKKNPKKFKKWYRDGTSGSTGIPLTIYRPWNEQAYIIAKWIRDLMINGYRPLTDKVFSIVSPHRINKRDSYLQRFGLFRRYTISYLSPTNELVEKYNEFKPHLFYANKSQMIMMAEYAKKNNIKLWNPRIYSCNAETVEKSAKRIIQQAFGNKGYFESYGTVETGILGFQLKGGNDYYTICHDTNIIELGDNSDRAIVTDLLQFSFPILRYDIADKIKMEFIDGIKVIKKIYGRDDDWIICSNGKKIPFHLFYEIMERRHEIKQFRIVQESYRIIKIHIVKEENVNKSIIEKPILFDLKNEIDEKNLIFEIEWHDNIPPDPNGKIRMLISKVSQK